VILQGSEWLKEHLPNEEINTWPDLYRNVRDSTGQFIELKSAIHGK
jgi:hypothetical protein